MSSGFETLDLRDPREFLPVGLLDEDTLTSCSKEVAQMVGGRWISLNLTHSESSFSFITSRRSGIERSRAASRDIVVAGE